MSTTSTSLDERELELRRCIKEDKLSVLQPHLSVRINPEMPVKDVVQTMVDKKIGAVLIVENDELTGIFSERDLISKVALDFEAVKDKPIRDFMTPKPVHLSVNDTIAFALNHMDVGDYRHIPITDDEKKPAGIVAVRDIIRYIDHKCLGGPE